MIKLIELSPTGDSEGRAAARMTPHVAYGEDAKSCSDTCHGWTCVGIPGHESPHVAHTGPETAAAIWFDTEKFNEEAIQMFLRLIR